MKKIALLYPLNINSKNRYFDAIKELGFEPILIVGNSSSFPDEKNRVVLSGEKENASNISKILSGLGDVIAVIAAGEFSVELAEQVAESLNLQKSMNKPANILRNKAIMRKEFKKHGVNQPEVLGIASNIDELKDLVETIEHFPVISKPVDMAGSWFVSINSNRESIVKNSKPIFDYTFAKATGLKFDCKSMIEDFVEGEEYSAEVIVQDGHIVKYIVNKKILSDLPNFDEIGHVCGVNLGNKIESSILKNLRAILKAGGVINSILHVEFRVNQFGEVNVIEAGCRIAGDRISELVNMKYDINLEEIMVRLKSNLPLPDFNNQSEEIIAIRFLFDGVNASKNVNSIKIEKSDKNQQRNDLQYTHIANRIGYEIFTLSENDTFDGVFG
ncbi:ATP-grasp domain-containing protein [Vibrio sp. AK197]